MPTQTQPEKASASQKSAHTPGPWEIWGTPGEMDIAVGPEAGGVAVCQVVTVNGIGIMSEETAHEGVANAALIAAAPDLLGHLQTLAAILDAVDSGRITQWAEVGAKFYHGRDAIREAIAKATSRPL